MKSSIFAALSALLVIFCHSCRNSPNTMAENKPSMETASNLPANASSADSTIVSSDYGKGEPDDQASPSGKPAGDKTVQKKDWDKKIVRMADLNIEVKDYASFSDRFRKDIKDLGGWLSREEENESEYEIENRVSIKIPVDQFDNAVAELLSNHEKIIEKKITSDDVTTEVVDTKSRIEAKREIRLRYLDLLKQAKNMDEILQVQNEINDIQEQLESAAGRMQYLSHASAYSTINLTFFQILNAGAVVEKRPSYLQKANEAFQDGLKWFAGLLLGLISLWPMWVAGALVWFTYKKMRARKTKTA